MATDTLTHASAARTPQRAERSALLSRIESEYREMPGLTLTEVQVQRLWNLDEEACGSVLATLTRRRFLRRTSKGNYVRASA
jgi:hypothetical protein